MSRQLKYLPEMFSSSKKKPKLWGGVECTVNRVGSVRFDQIARTGHDRRPEDFDLFAGLGINALRFPVLWERVAPNGLNTADWSTTDVQLDRLSELGIEPIIGLLHHGSGPSGTSLLDPCFPELFAEYAHSVAKRYPWVVRFAPVNEPLTTARFSGLYGHWHPHAKDDFTFSRILINQCKAIVLAMEAIRAVIPDAQLMVTEDVGRTFSTQYLAYQADFENERRWSSIDMLCGRLLPGTRMREHFEWLGIASRDLRWFEDHFCAPDVIGIDYYPTSERFLDEDWSKYPPSARGGNGYCEYADIEAVRVRKEGIDGHFSVLQETWLRYGVPVALTECHIACTVEEQIAWFYDSWRAAQRATLHGMPVEGVTLWSLLGAYDWDSLCTMNRGYYEAGAFDVRSGIPVPTKLASAVVDIVEGRHVPHASHGWWRRGDRLLYPPISAPSAMLAPERELCAA